MQLQTVLYFLVWAGLFFVMMRFGCGAHVIGHGHHHGGSRPDDDRGSGRNLRWSPPDQATDPVCGTTVQTAGAKSTVHDGHVYYFCSQTCRENPLCACSKLPKHLTALLTVFSKVPCRA